jgi:hypothetical protein
MAGHHGKKGDATKGPVQEAHTNVGIMEDVLEVYTWLACLCTALQELTQMCADMLLQSLTAAIPAPLPVTKRAWQSWISNETWKVVDEHSALQRLPNHDRAEAQWLD